MCVGRCVVGLEAILGALPVGTGKESRDVHLVDLGKSLSKLSTLSIDNISIVQ